MSEVSPKKTNKINVVSWNMLLDNTKTLKGIIRPQFARLPGHIATLSSFAGSLDVVGIQEAAYEVKGNNGVALAKALGFSTSFFFQHNLPQAGIKGRGRRNEFIGMFGGLVDNAEPIYLGDNRIAVKTYVGSVAFVTYHLRQGLENRPLRIEQASRLIEAVSDSPKVAFLGDGNEKNTSPAMRLLKSEGFEPVSLGSEGSEIITYPVPEYHETMHLNADGTPKPSVQIDHLNTRGLTVLDAGIIEPITPNKRNILGAKSTLPTGPSDHYPVWMTVEAA